MQVPLEDDSDSRFLIIDHFDQIDDFSGELLILKNMKQIGTDIIARMLHDHIKCEPLAAKAIPGFNVNTVTYEMIGPVFDNDYGVMLSFKLQDCLDLDYHAEKWIKL